MLTKQARKRLSFAFTLISFFCLLPYDWSREKEIFTKTKYKHKIFFNRFIGFLVPTVVIYLGIAFAIDLLNDAVDNGAFFIVFMFFTLGIVISSCALSIVFDVDTVAFIINNTLMIDKLFQDTFLTRKQIKSYQKKTSLTVMTSNIIEPISIFHTFSLGMLFWQDFDPFNRYFYYYFKTYLHLDSIWFEIGGLLIYMGFIRLCYGLFVLLAFVASPYLETTSFWLNYMTHHYSIEPDDDENESEQDPQLTAKKYKLLKWFINTESVLNHTLTSSWYVRYFLSIVFAFVCIPIVIQLYGTIKLFGVLPFGVYISLPTLAILLIALIEVWFRSAGQIESLSKQLLRHWYIKIGTEGRKSRVKTKCRKEILIFLSSAPPMTIALNNLFACNCSTFVIFLQQVIDKAVTLLVST